MEPCRQTDSQALEVYTETGSGREATRQPLSAQTNALVETQNKQNRPAFAEHLSATDQGSFTSQADTSVARRWRNCSVYTPRDPVREARQVAVSHQTRC